MIKVPPLGGQSLRAFAFAGHMHYTDQLWCITAAAISTGPLARPWVHSCKKP